MFAALFALFVIVPFVELAILIYLGRSLGAWPTIFLVLFTGLVGASLAKWQGLHVWREIQAETARGRMPASRLMDGVFIFIAGLLLITPGLLTDITGFLLLIPATRNVCKIWLKHWLMERIRRGTIHVQTGGFGPGMPPDDSGYYEDSQPEVLRARVIENTEYKDIDGEFTVDEEPEDPSGSRGNTFEEGEDERDGRQ